MHRLQQFFAWCLALMLMAPLQPALAQNTLSQAQLDQLTAPVALYPDALLSQVLMAATYPADVAAAAQWSKANPSLSGDAATKAVASQSWDPSVQSLAAFPSVLDMMGRQPQWVQSIGDAFLAQPNDVMDSVQRLRLQAQKAGTLKTTEQQKVVTQSSGGTTVVQIEPANPQVVYVPTYNPTTVYGSWPYPAYPPAYYPPPPGSVFATAVVSGIGFGLGVAAVDAMWGGFDWHDHDVNINVNRYNNINVNQRLDVNRANVNWQHNPARRGDVPYNNAAVRGRYDQQRQAGLANRQAGTQPGQRLGGAGAVQREPSARDQARDRAARSFEGRTGQAIPGHAGGVAGRTEGARPGAGGAGTHNPRPAGVEHQRADQAAARDRARNANRDSALRDAGNGERMREQTQRAGLSQQQMRPAVHDQGGMRQGGMHQGGGLGGGGRLGGGEHFGHGRR